MLIKLENGIPVGYPLVDANFKQLYPNVSFPSPLTPEAVEPFGYGLYEFSEQPAPGRYQKVVEVTPVKNQVGVWIQTWAVVEKNAEEKAAEDTAKANSVRNQRNILLSQSDWTQVADSPVDKAPWAAYREDLRNVPSQPGFPWNVVWPAKP